MLIVLIGPDGCGKTTLANKLVEKMHERGRRSYFFEMTFGIIPRFRDIASFIMRRKVGRSHETGALLAGMSYPPNSPTRALVYAVWYGLDYLAGRWKYRKELKSDLVLFARYSYDYAFQRAYMRMPNFGTRLIFACAPQPDFVFTIYRGANEIFSQKPELSPSEIERQQRAIKKLLCNRSNFYVLDGSRGVEATLRDLLAIIDVDRR